MYKRIFTYLLVLLVLVVGYSKVVKTYVQTYNKYDRTLVVYDYDGNNYVGKYNYQDQLISLIKLESSLKIAENKTIGDVKSAKELQAVIKDSFLYETDDYFEFDKEKLVKDNLDSKTEKLYKNTYNKYKVVKNILDGNVEKYHPDYNKELLRIEKSINEDDDGVMNKSKVKAMISAKIPEEKVILGFVSVQNPNLSCEKDICTISEEEYSDLRTMYNKKTKNKLPEYDDIVENITTIDKKSTEEKAVKEKAAKEKAAKEKAAKKKAAKKKAAKKKAAKKKAAKKKAEEATTVEPTTVEVTTVEPTTVEPTTVEPTTVEATTVEPTTVEPTTVEPTTVEPTTVEPTTKEVTTEATTVEPTTKEVTTVEPTSDITTTAEEVTTSNGENSTTELNNTTSSVSADKTTTVEVNE